MSSELSVNLAFALNQEGQEEITDIKEFIRIIEESSDKKVIEKGYDDRDIELDVGGKIVRLVYENDIWQAASTDEEIQREVDEMQAAGLTGLEDLEDNEPIDYFNTDEKDDHEDEDEDFTTTLYPNEESREERYELLNKDIEKFRDRN
ncbi:hypothetical protein [Paenibacillus sp. WLX2291]|uniref:hypothetical protein n=1 Tax=Paenibacillus sp. WLX2291 TaxID=3296934 RepID=UPI0039845902